MKIMIIEDNNAKITKIKSHLNSKGVKDEDIIISKNMSDFASKLNYEVDLFVIDFNIPNCDDGESQPNGLAILESIIKSGKGDALLLAISSYPEDFPNLREKYESNGCILADFKNEKSWKSTLDYLLLHLKNKLRLDFVIFCALEEERFPYIILTDNGKNVIRGGIDCYDIDLNGLNGTVILLPEMGLVNAAIYAGTCIEKFKPKLIGMSGICGGFGKKVKLGQLLLSSFSYEYQSGKWSSDTFLNAPYQASTDHVTLTHLKAILAQPDLITTLESEFTGIKPDEKVKPEAVVFTSGSAVIASQKKLEHIASFHSKVSAVDMEIFAIQQAAKLSQYNPASICAKVVVDLCDESKNDDYHSYGCYISAKFMLKAIPTILNELNRNKN